MSADDASVTLTIRTYRTLDIGIRVVNRAPNWMGDAPDRALNWMLARFPRLFYSIT